MKDVKVEDIAQDVNKITDEELKSVQEKVNKINQAQMTVGGLEVQKGIALQTIGALQVELQTIQKELEEKYGHSDWYSFNTAEWGTKWDVGSDDDDGGEIVPIGKDKETGMGI